MNEKKLKEILDTPCPELEQANSLEEWIDIQIGRIYHLFTPLELEIMGLANDLIDMERLGLNSRNIHEKIIFVSKGETSIDSDTFRKDEK